MSLTLDRRLLLLAAVPWLSCSKPDAGHATTRPRLVLLTVIDTLRADHLSCYGHTRETSPNIDRFAAGAIRFDNAFAPASWTKPSMPSLMTGRMPSAHGVFEGNSKDDAGRITSDILGDGEFTLAEAMAERGYATGGFVQNAHLKPFLGFGQGFDEYREGLGGAANIHAAFLAWLDQTLRDHPDRPVFGYVHVLDVHWPYLPPPAALAAIPTPAVELDLSEAGQKQLRDAVNDGERVLTAAEQDALRALYDACIRGYDSAFAELLAALRERELLDDALIVVTSDHGEEFGERGKLGHGHSLSDGLLRVPLLIQTPGSREAGVRRELVSLTDVYPTLLHFVGAPIRAGVSGRDLFGDDRPADVFAELMHGRRYEQAVRTGSWKLAQEFTQLGEPIAASAATLPQLAVGMRVEAKARFDAEEGEFEVKELTLEISDDDDFEVRGAIEAIDTATGHLTVGPFRVAADRDRAIPVRDGSPIAFADLRPGQVIDIDAGRIDGVAFKADKLEVRPDKSASRSLKIEGVVSAVSRSGHEFSLGGLELTRKDDTPHTGWPDQVVVTKRRVPLSAIRPEILHDATRFDRTAHLYRMDRQGEDHDVLAQHPDIEARLVERLRVLRHDGQAAVTEIELDSATQAELQRIGYLGGG